jgi:hypothetical protein
MHRRDFLSIHWFQNRITPPEALATNAWGILQKCCVDQRCLVVMNGVAIALIERSNIHLGRRKIFWGR